MIFKLLIFKLKLKFKIKFKFGTFFDGQISISKSLNYFRFANSMISQFANSTISKFKTANPLSLSPCMKTF